MLKVFLVEDEFVVRQGIKKNIAWEEHGYDFCGEASDGELALPLIRKHKPDILITDIKMPFMDGLELSRIVRKEFPHMEIMILSGHEEFSYAKEAIRLGISSYLLKPISGDALLREVDQVAARIREARREQEIREQYRKEMEENAHVERQHFFRDLVGGGRTVSELLERAEHFHMDLSAGRYSIVLVKLGWEDARPIEFVDPLVQANARLEGVEDPRLLVFDRDLEGFGVLIKGETEEDHAQALQVLLTLIREIPEEFGPIRYAVGVGTPVNRLSELKKSFDYAARAFAHRFFNPGSCIIEHTEDIPAGDDLNLKDIDPKSINRSRIMDFLRTGDQGEVRWFVRDFFESIGSSAMESMLFRQYIVLGAYFSVVEFVEELQFSRDELTPLDVAGCAAQGTEFAEQYMVEILEQALSIRRRSATNHYGTMVEETMRFIEENYADPDLSLNMAASHVKFSPNYLSKVFSEQTGETFIKYLTDFRMNKAKEMLRCTTRKSSEIAYDVGYKDPHYFSFLFKKQTGMSPKQFRGEAADR